MAGTEFSLLPLLCVQNSLVAGGGRHEIDSSESSVIHPLNFFRPWIIRISVLGGKIWREIIIIPHLKYPTFLKLLAISIERNQFLTTCNSILDIADSIIDIAYTQLLANQYSILPAWTVLLSFLVEVHLYPVILFHLEFLAKFQLSIMFKLANVLGFHAIIYVHCLHILSYICIWPKSARFSGKLLSKFWWTGCMTRPSDGGRGRGRGILPVVTRCHPSSPVVPCRHPLSPIVTRSRSSTPVTTRSHPL